MDTAFQIAAVCLVGALLSVVIKKTSPSMALLLAVAICLAALAVLCRTVGEVKSFLQQVAQWGGLSAELFAPLLKVVAIALVSRVGGALCRDAGEGAIAAMIEMSGAFAAIVASLPLFASAWRVLEELV